MNRRSGVVILLALLVWCLSACGGEPDPDAIVSSPVAPIGTYAVKLVAGGGTDRTTSSASDRLLQVTADTVLQNDLVQFDVATDGAVWAATGSPNVDYLSKPLSFPEALVRLDISGVVLDVGFDFVDPTSIDGGRSDDDVAILSGPVSNGTGGVVVVIGPAHPFDEIPAWSQLYSIDADGEVMLVNAPEGLAPTDVGQSAADGYLVQARHTVFRSCQQVFKVDDSQTDWMLAIGRDCTKSYSEATALADLAQNPTAPRDIQLDYGPMLGFATALLPDGRVVLLDENQGLFVEDDGVLQLIVSSAPQKSEDAARASPKSPYYWNPLAVAEPLIPFGTASDVYTGWARLSVNSAGQISFLMTSQMTPAMDTLAFHFDVRDVPAGNIIQQWANTGISAVVARDGAPVPEVVGEVRGRGVVLLDPVNGGNGMQWAASMVSGYGQPCRWRGEQEAVCAIAGRSPVRGLSAWAVAFVAVTIP